MKHKLIPAILILTVLIISACSSAAAPAEPTPGSEYPTPEAPPFGYGYPVEGGENLSPDNSRLPLDSAPWSALAPLDSDANLVRGNFEVTSAELQAVQEEQGATALFVEGSLPTPCNEPRAYVSLPDENNIIHVELYSVSDPERTCAQVIQPFSGVVANFSDIPAGQYQVFINDAVVGEFMAP